MALSNNEISAMLSKLRNKYTEYSDKYNSKYFDIYQFEQRYRHSLNNNMNKEAFILSEIAHFEKMREMFETKKTQVSVSDKFDKIIEENLSRIIKYPKITIHSNADIEITHLYGALNFIYEKIFPVMWIIIKESSKKNMLSNLDNSLAEFAAYTDGRLAKRVEDYLMTISRRDISEIDKEKSKNLYLKEAAFQLHLLSEFCEKLINNPEQNFELPLNFSGSNISEAHRKLFLKEFSNSTGFGAIMKVKESADIIIDDFRLNAFKKS